MLAALAALSGMVNNASLECAKCKANCAAKSVFPLLPVPSLEGIPSLNNVTLSLLENITGKPIEILLGHTLDSIQTSAQLTTKAVVAIQTMGPNMILVKLKPKNYRAGAPPARPCHNTWFCAVCQDSSGACPRIAPGKGDRHLFMLA